MSKKATLKSISLEAGTSLGTVSRALKDDPKIAITTRKRIKALAEQLGYVPDRAAQRLKTGKTKVVSLILDPHNEILGFGNSLVSGLTQGLDGSGYNLTITPHFSGKSKDSLIEHIVHNNQADGIIFSRTKPFDDRVRYLLEHKFPFVCHGRTEFSLPHPVVDFDNQVFCYEAARRLASKGVKKICLFAPDRRFTFHQHLTYGLALAAKESGTRFIVPDDITLDDSTQDIRNWVVKNQGSEDAADGFICPGESCYFSLIDAMRSLDRKQGRDYQAVVKTSTSILQHIDPDVDKIHEDIHLAGKKMASILLDQMQLDIGYEKQFIQVPDVDWD
ncbi:MULTISPECIES: LacI family transcriptional regulator [unclassified Lentilitoribacter]|jgi:LacI family transcriptional regulator|uniref:LacI family transcriptional regulator n=1 Tax=unclassified Lentilitoribacter TaxID=2647570 RepID=UPI0013A6EC42|nr:LacI family transcriptional regulator [Lentilitoribacter sp. Alg239-R112]